MATPNGNIHATDMADQVKGAVEQSFLIHFIEMFISHK